MSFPRYPSYKDSGVAWLGEVPGHWKVSRLGFESWVRARLGWKGLKAEEYVDDGFAFLATPNIKRQEIDFENVNFITQGRFDESPEIKLSEGDVLLAKDGSTLGTVNIVRSLPRPTTVNSSIAVITPNTNLSGVFLFYVFASSYIEQTIQRTKGGMGVPHLFQADLNKFYMPLPDRGEQTQIAAFLDRETAKIDALVAEQRRLMELLKEKRQAVISHAVTKGLNPNAPMKPSGIEWLGDVPKHWRVMALGRITISRCDGPFGSGLKSEHYTDSGVRVIRLQNIRRDGFNDTDAAFINANYYESELSGHDVIAGDVLIAGLGDDKNTVGRACVAPVGVEPAMVKADCFRYRLDTTQALPEFIATQLSASSASDAGVMSSGSTRSRIPLSVMATRKLAIPPLSEQIEIAKLIGAQSLAFDTLTAEAQRAIDLLQERRTALISAAVTGQVDVRHLSGDFAK